MAPATAQALTFETEGDAGNANENRRELACVKQLNRRHRLHDSKFTGHQLGPIAHAMGRHLSGRRIDAREKDRVAGGNRLGHKQAGRNLVAL